MTMTMAITPPTTEPMPPADTTPPPPLPDFNAINSLTSAQRSSAITNPANTENDSITKSAQTQDSVSVVANSAGLGFFVNNEGATVGIRVDNLNPDADWTENARPLLSTSYIFDSVSFASKTLADYNDGDFYAVTGFWYRDSDDFGVFADGSPRTVDLPATGSANYRGNIGGQYWGDIATRTDDTGAPNITGSFVGNINLQAVTINSNITGLSGAITIPADGILPDISLGWTLIFDNNRNGVYTDANRIRCPAGCDESPTASSLSARLVGDPVSIPGGANSEGWPAGVIGTFGLQDMRIGNTEVDMLGFFGAIHEDLCAATGTGDNAFCTKP